MAPTIEVDDEVWNWLKQQAVPLEDTPNTVLRRIAGLDGQTAGGPSPTMRPLPSVPIRSRRATGEKTPQSAFREPILRFLRSRGGAGTRSQVLQAVESMLADRLTDFDRSGISSGSIRWQKSAEWEVSVMRQEGLLEPQHRSMRGEWKLTPNGQQVADALGTTA